VTASGSTISSFLWSEGNMQDLGLLPGSTECFATAISDRGQAVGYCGGGFSIDKVFRWAADTGMTTIETPDWAVAYGINSQGDMVGSLNATPGSTTDIHAFRYRNGAMEELGPGRALGTNDLGQVVGSNTDGTRALLWDEDGAHDLGSLEGPDGRSGAFAINADGIPAGNSTTGGPCGERHAVLWTPSGISNLGSLGGVYASANAISGDLRLDQLLRTLASAKSFHLSTRSDAERTVAMVMSLPALLVLLVIAAICGAIGRRLAGGGGGLITSIFIGFVGALLGPWVAHQLNLSEPLMVHVGGRPFPIVWSIVGAAMFVALLHLIFRRRILT
jgi:probable HAF family extracellular repeat protein